MAQSSTASVVIPTTRTISFPTDSADSANQPIQFFYNSSRSTRTNTVSHQLLDKNTFYFTDNRYGNRYHFNGDVTTSGNLSSGGAFNSKNWSVSNENISVNNSTSTTPTLFLSNDGYGYDWENLKRNTLMIGGANRSAIAGIKASCQNISGGDLGGSCYQFTDMGGQQGNNRSGAGLSDGINMDMRATDNSPLDVIGANQLIQNTDGSYHVKGVQLFPATAVAVGATQFKIKGMVGCGVGVGQSHCELSGASVITLAGKILTTTKVTAGPYDPTTQTTLMQLGDGNTLNAPLTVSTPLSVLYYSGDGTAYGVSFGQDGTPGAYGAAYTLIYPALSLEEQALILSRMAIWTNLADGMQSTEGGSNEDDANVDMPNYYYGYNSGIGVVAINQANIDRINADTTLTPAQKQQAIRLNQYTRMNVETSYYPGTGDAKGGWRTLEASNTGAHNTPRFILVQQGNTIVQKNSDGSQITPQLDYRLTYAYPQTGTLTHNSNYHHYAQPALFLGLNNKNFNLYAMQAHVDAPDSITRAYDNEWDFWMLPRKNNPNAAVNSRGLTLTWGNSTGPFATGSYMMRLAGSNLMPIGIKVDGVNPYGGYTVRSDAGFSVQRWAFPSNAYLKNVNDMMSIAALGQAKTNQGSYQLFSYMSNDGQANNSLHLGLTKQPSTDPLHYLGWNDSPNCHNDGSCTILGQVIFDPAGYKGGIALGSGQGKTTQLGVIVDANSQVVVPHNVTIDQTLAVKKTIFAHQLISPLSTPSSSSAPCTAGEFRDDANYHYVCVATNKWKRVALSDF